MPKLDISFKKTTRDMRLYLEIINKEEKSDFVKDAVESYIEKLKNEQNKKGL